MCENVTHRFGDVTALDDISLEVGDREFLTLLGPSGCGKTTLLRIISGFTRPTSGRILLGGEDVTRVPASKRPTNLVFQRPTIFPHLDVGENVAFGLRLKKTPAAELPRRVADALRLVRLDGFEDRRSHELSGGQMQRVALARALANEPELLLLDEPFSALDLKVRLEMEGEVRRLHRETNTTIVFVTHDQREALALSDRIALFNKGRIEQVATPNELYRRPESLFAARFVGDANVLPALITDDGWVVIGDQRVSFPDLAVSGTRALVIRPETVVVESYTGSDSHFGVDGVVTDLAYRGSVLSCAISVRGLDEPLRADIPAAGGPPAAIGERVFASWRPEDCLVLPPEDSASAVPNEGHEVAHRPGPEREKSDYNRRR